jgi:hypothetical protein
MADNKNDLLERRLTSLETQMASMAQSQQQYTAYALSGFLTGKSLIQMFFDEATRQAFLTVPVNPFPLPPPIPPAPLPNHCHIDCKQKYDIALTAAGTDVAKKQEAQETYAACISKCPI